MDKLGDIIETSLGRAKIAMAIEDEDGDITCIGCIFFPAKSCEGFRCTSASRKDNLDVIFKPIDNLQNKQKEIQDLQNQIENLKIEFRKEFESQEMDLIEQFHKEFSDITIDGIFLSGIYIYTEDFNYQYKDNHWQKF